MYEKQRYWMWCDDYYSRKIWWCQRAWTKRIIIATFRYWISFKWVLLLPAKNRSKWSLLQFVSPAGRGWSNASSQISAAHSWTKIGPIHSMGSDKYSSGAVTEQPICAKQSSGLWSHVGQSYEHLFGKFAFLTEYTFGPTTIFILLTLT